MAVGLLGLLQELILNVLTAVPTNTARSTFERFSCTPGTELMNPVVPTGRTTQALGVGPGLGGLAWAAWV